MRNLFFIYGVLSYLVFFATFLYLIGFISNVGVPKSMDSGTELPFIEALLINLLLVAVFAVQHSVMARKSFKEKWVKIVSPVIERSSYVLISSLALLLLVIYWQPMGGVVWDASGSTLGNVLIGVSILGWVIVFISTFLIDHFELFGLKQVYLNLRGRELQQGDFKTPGFYKVVRHPMYFGFFLAFCATPTMTAAHLIFALGMITYIFVGVFFEEKDLERVFGDEYKNYKQRVPMVIPMPTKKSR